MKNKSFHYSPDKRRYQTKQQMPVKNKGGRSFYAYIRPFLYIVLFVALIYAGINSLQNWDSQSQMASTNQTEVQGQDIEILVGSAEIKKSGNEAFTSLSSSHQVSAGDIIQTEKDSRIALIINQNQIIRLRENTRIQLQNLSQKAGEINIHIMLETWELWTRVTKDFTNTDLFMLETPLTVASIKGTVLDLAYDRITQSSHLRVHEGEVSYSVKDSLTTDTKPQMLDNIIVSEGYQSEVSLSDTAKFAQSSDGLESRSISQENINPWEAWNYLEDKRFLETKEQRLEIMLSKYQDKGIFENMLTLFSKDDKVKGLKQEYLSTQKHIRNLPLKEEMQSWMQDAALQAQTQTGEDTSQEAPKSVAPDTPADTLEKTTTPPTENKDPNAIADMTYTVNPGESLSSIGIYYGFDWEKLADINDFGSGDVLQIGEELKLTNNMAQKIRSINESQTNEKQAVSTPDDWQDTSKKETPKEPNTETSDDISSMVYTIDPIEPNTQNSDDISSMVYTVDPGESISSIGIYYGFDWKKLAQINDLSTGATLQIGQKLKLTETMAKKIQAKDAAVNESRLERDS